MMALTKEQMDQIIAGFFSDPDYDELWSSVAWPSKTVSHEVDYEHRNQMVESFEVRNDLNCWGYWEVVAVVATSGSLCGSCWAEYPEEITTWDSASYLWEVLMTIIESIL